MSFGAGRDAIEGLSLINGMEPGQKVPAGTLLKIVERGR
jgi:hypothetical protein